MEIELETRIELEPGKRLYVCEAETEYLYGPCNVCLGTGEIEVKSSGVKLICPECRGKDSMKHEETGTISKWHVGKFYVESIHFNADGKVVSFHLQRCDKRGSYGATFADNGYSNKMYDLEMYGEKFSEDYSEILREVKKRNREEREEK